MRSEYAANIALQALDKAQERAKVLSLANAIMHKPTPFRERLAELLELDQTIKFEV